MAVTTLFPETTVGFTLNESVGLYTFGFSPSPVTLVGGETYNFVWDGEEWNCTAVLFEGEGAVVLGNLSLFSSDYEDTKEPFIVMCAVDGSFVEIGTKETDATHTIAIYQGEEDGLVIQNRYGEDETYIGAEIVRIRKTDGNIQTFSKGETMEKTVELDFSNGGMVITPDADKLFNSVTIPKPSTLIAENIRENVEVAGVKGALVDNAQEELNVELDFSSGDMEITADEGKVFSKVNIPLPETLIPANIAEGVNVAGVIGALAAGGGGGAVYASGSFAGNDSYVTVEHNLGVVPDILIVNTASNPATTTSACIKTIVAFSDAMKTLLNVPWYQLGALVRKATGSSYYGFSYPEAMTSDMTGTGGQINNVTETSMTVGLGTTYRTGSSKTYYWFAIGGLT